MVKVGVVKVGVVKVGVVVVGSESMVVGGSDGENDWGACGVWEYDNVGADAGESSKLSLSASIWLIRLLA